MKSLYAALIAAGPRMWGLLLAGPIVTALVVYFAEVVRTLPVPDHLLKAKVDFLGWGEIGAVMLLGIVVTALAAARVNVRTFGGTEFTADASDNRSAPSQRITTTVETKPNA